MTRDEVTEFYGAKVGKVLTAIRGALVEVDKVLVGDEVQVAPAGHAIVITRS